MNARYGDNEVQISDPIIPGRHALCGVCRWWLFHYLVILSPDFLHRYGEDGHGVLQGSIQYAHLLGIRTTKLIDAGGNIKIVNNSEIKTIINQTQELSLAKAYVSVSYDARIEKIEAVIADNLGSFKSKIPAIVEGPFYKGVTELGESGVNLLFVAKCYEDDIYQVQRDMNREIKIMFDNNNIEIPFNQLVVHMAEDEQDPLKLSKTTIRKANSFNEEQKELSKDISVEK